MRTRRSELMALGVMLVLPILLTRCSDPIEMALRPECPEGGEWSKVFSTDTSTQRYGLVPKGELSGSEGITDIVEFHDCQQFIVTDVNSKKLRYSSLFAIFARLRLDKPYEYVREYRDHIVRFDSATMGMPMATIFSYDSAYAPLGIAQGFNCLFFFKTSDPAQSGWEAKMVSTKGKQDICGRPQLSKTATGGTPLTVSVVQELKPGFDTPPPVARWDWDTTSHTQYIGIRCGDSWCEVHPNLSSGTQFASSAPLPEVAARSKGWYDEQILAVAGNPADSPPEVSAIRGTFIPAEKLGDYNGPESSSQFVANWIQVAKVAVRGNPGGYTSKLNLISAKEDAADNIVWSCYADPSKSQICPGADPAALKCADPGWYGMITHRSGTSPQKTEYFCVKRRDHDVGSGMLAHPAIPGVVRWRWALDDETMWYRCLNGCCEVKPH